MTRADATFYISLISIALSILTFLITFAKSKKELFGNLDIRCQFSADNSSLEIIVMNRSFGATTILSYDILYAANQYYEQTIKTIKLEPPTLLMHSQTNTLDLKRSDLRQALIENGISQLRYHLLQIRVNTTNYGQFTFPIKVPLIDTGFEDLGEFARNYVATDLFLGFPPMPAEYSKSGMTLVGSHK